VRREAEGLVRGVAISVGGPLVPVKLDVDKVFALTAALPPSPSTPEGTKSAGTVAQAPWRWPKAGAGFTLPLKQPRFRGPLSAADVAEVNVNLTELRLNANFKYSFTNPQRPEWNLDNVYVSQGSAC